MPTTLPPQISSVDEDPFINAQVNATKVGIGKPYTAGENLDMVAVSPFLRGMAPDEPTIKVYCVKQGDKWVIANLVYPGDAEMGVKSWNLKDHLKQGLGILSSGNDTGYVGEDPSTMLSTEEMLMGKWNDQVNYVTKNGTTAEKIIQRGALTTAVAATSIAVVTGAAELKLGKQIIVDGPQSRGGRIFQVRPKGEPGFFRLDLHPLGRHAPRGLEGVKLPHYHRAPNMRLHRPYQGF